MSSSSSHQKHPPKPRPHQSLFRILCNAPTGGAIIGTSGKIITQLRHDTGAKIHCCEPVPGSNERVVIIVGDRKVTRTMELVNNSDENEVVTFQVSCAQEALLRVVARVIEVERGGVWCRIVVDGSQVGAVLGKGGRNVKRIREVTGAGVEIRPLSSGFRGSCHDRIVVITGDVLAMNKALHAVSCCLQDFPPVENHGLHLSAPSGPLPNPHMEFFSHLNTNNSHFASYPVGHGFSGHSVSLNISTLASQSKQQEVVFRLLCDVDVAGGVIGWRGSVVKAFEDETSASIIFASPMDDCQDRVVTISAMEDLESCNSPAQRAILCVFRKSFELSRSRYNAQTRLLVEPPYIDCLTGSQGQTVLQIKQATGSSILIMGGDHIPKCAGENDVVVQISGDFNSVHNALILVTSKLRECLLPSGVLNVGKLIHPSSPDPHFSNNGTVHAVVSAGSLQTFGLLPDLYQKAPIVEGIQQLRLSPKNDNYSLMKTTDERTLIYKNGGCSTTTEGSDQGRSAIVTKTTIEIAVPKHLFATIFSEDENNLAHMRQISGAELEVYGPKDDKNEGKVVISGTPNQTMAAQNLLQAFILAKQ